MLGALALLSVCLCAGFLTPLALSVYVLVRSNLGIDSVGMTDIMFLDALAPG
jgi:hypothetical protein